MVLIRYFFKRFFSYFIVINVSFTLLFNLIEFFEKLVRANQVSITTILHFIALNIPTSFFENFAISTWLATCLLIKELAQQNEWEALNILTISNKKVFSILLYIGIILSIISFVGKEKLILTLWNKAETFKIEKLKQSSQQKLVNKWIILPQDSFKHKNVFCFFQFLDLQKNTGTGLILLYMNEHFQIEKTLQSTSFYTYTQKKQIHIPEGITIETNNSTQKKIQHKTIFMPSFFSQLQLGLKIPTLSIITKNLISGKNILPDIVLNNLLLQLLTRIISHIHVFIYPLLTFLLFALFAPYKRYRWCAILLPYPFITFLDIAINFIIQKGFTAWFIVWIYLIFVFLIFLLKKKLEKSHQ